MTGAGAGRGSLLKGGLALVLAMLGAFGCWWGYRWSEQGAYRGLSEEGRDRLTLYGAALSGEVDKNRNVPVVLASDADIVAILADPTAMFREPGILQALNHRLQSMNGSLAVDSVYVLNRDGVVIASANWSRGLGSFVGQHLDFRSYFVSAMTGAEGRELAVGTTAGQFGYYIAMPVRGDGAIVGAVAVKMVMDGLERAWSGGGERVVVTDRNGVIFITNQPEWRFRMMPGVGADAMVRLESARHYAGRRLNPLPMEEKDGLVAVDGNDYVMVSKPLINGDGWTMHVLMDVAEARARARDRAFLGVMVAASLVLMAALALTRARLLHRYARALERNVATRTAELVSSNERLQGEIGERMRAERELKGQQEALIQSAKLAALGQMSAGLSHEINQPLAAIRAYADNAVKLLALGRAETVRDNLVEIAGLTERIARLSGELKLFARKSDGALDRVGLGNAVERALSLLAGRMQVAGVRLDWTPPGSEILVWGNALRLEQVFVNLLRNALDAVEGRPDPAISVRLTEADGRVSVAIGDNGPGIAQDVMPQLFDPFFTTKPAEQGLGLGLSISDGIVRSMGGRIGAANHPKSGAEFTVILNGAESVHEP